MSIRTLTHFNVKPTLHFKHRLSNRLHIKSPRSRRIFIRKASLEALAIRDIPKEDFSSFLTYMANKEKFVRKSNPYLRLFLYQDWFIVVSCSGDLITIYNVDSEWKGTFDRILTQKFYESAWGDIEVTEKGEVNDDGT